MLYQPKRFLLFFLIISSVRVNARLDSNSFLSFHAIGGPSFGIGSFSQHSAKPNSLGKFLNGVNLNMNVEFILKRKFAIGLSLTGNSYKVKNEFIRSEIERRRDNLFPDATLTDFKMQLECYYANASLLFQIKKFIIQPKFNAGVCQITYQYSDSFHPGNNTVGLPSTYYYSASKEQKIHFSLLTELHLKYIIARRSGGDIALNLGIGYLLALAKIDILEERITYTSFVATRAGYNFITLKSPVQTLNTSLGITWFIKKSSKK